MSFARRLLVPLVLGASLAFISGCGGNEEEETEQAPQEQSASAETGGADFGHIHGLGVSSDDRTLFVATHNGLHSVPRGSRTPELVGDTRKDVMGFSVVSPERFVGSGHPAPDEDLPPNLGLIESRDRGKTWKSISLSGEADFHVLRSSGDRVYGFDGRRGLLASTDGGRSWDERATPAPLFDLALDPRSPERLIAATEQGLFSSPDGGKTWRPVNAQIAGLLAWPSRNELYLVDGSGQVQRSSDGGRSFTAAGSAGGQPVAFISHQDDLYVALSDNTVRRSTDGGASWTVRAAP